MTTREMRRLELNARWLGVEETFLMEAAGAGVAAVISEDYDPDSVTVVCGTGGNGGDGFVAARYLASEGREVEVFLVGRREAVRNEGTRLNMKRAEASGLRIVELRDSDQVPEAFDGDVVVDALLGFGVRGPLREPVRSAVEAINAASERGSVVVSIDVPTGLDPDTGEVHDLAVEPNLIASVHDHKKGVVEALPDVVLRRVNVGIPPTAEHVVGPGDVVVSGVLDRDPDSHKGQNGSVLVVGGSHVYVGAPRLTALGALRAGADLVFLLTVEEVPRDDPDIIYVPVDGPYVEPSELEVAPWDKVDAVVVGPGLDGTNTRGVVRKVSEEHDGPVIVDADGLRGVSDLDLDERFILTPHPGELAREFGVDVPDDPEGRAEVASRLASEYGCTLVVTGRVDVIASPDGDVRYNVTGSPGMTVGGTGDVLAGVIGTMASVLDDPFEAACVGAFLVGAAGQRAERKKSYAFTATDVAEGVPKILRNPWSARPTGLDALVQ